MKLVYSHEVMKERTLKGFGKRLAAIRQSKGLTQALRGSLPDHAVTYTARPEGG